MKPVLTIDPQFQSLIPPLSDDELDLLKEQITQKGCLEPLYVWKSGDNRILLDGHNRYRICTENSLPYTFVKVPSVGSREEAKLWILEHQAGRRNLTDDQRAVIWNDVRESRSKLAVAEKLQKAREAKASSRPMSAKTTEIVSPKRDTRKEIAKKAKLPENKLRQAQGLKKAHPKLYEEVRTGTKTLRAARKQVRGEGKKPNPRRDRDYFQRIGRRLDGVFKGEFKGRLDELSRLKSDEITPGVQEGIRGIVPILEEVAHHAVGYAAALEALLGLKKTEAA